MSLPVYLMVISLTFIQINPSHAQTNKTVIQDSIIKLKSFWVGDSLMRKGKYQDAILPFNQTAEQLKSGDNKLAYAETLNKLSEAYWRSGQLPTAMKTAKKGRQINQQVKDSQSKRLVEGNLLNNLCVINALAGDYEKSFEYGHLAIAMYKKDSAKHASRLASAYTRMGFAYSSAGNIDKTLIYNQKSLAINEQIFGTNHDATAGSYVNLGILYANKGNYNKAIILLEKSLGIYKIIYPADAPQIANALFNIGTVYHSQKETDKALEHYLYALHIFEKTPETFYLEISNAYNNIALVYSESNRYEASIEWHRKALNLRKRIFGDAHSLVAFTYTNLGLLNRYMGKDSIALSYHFKALEIQQQTTERSSPDIARSYQNIGDTYRSMGQYELALDNLNLSLKASAASLGRYHPLRVRTLNFQAQTYLAMGEIDRGLNSIEAAFEANALEAYLLDKSVDSLISGTLDLRELLSSLVWETNLLLAKDQKSDDLVYLTRAYHHVYIGDQIIDYVRKSQQRLGDQLNFGSLSTAIYKAAIRTCYRLSDKTQDESYKERAFYFIEKAKAAVLAQNLFDKNARSFEILPKELVDFEQSINDELSHLQSKITETLSSGGLYDTAQVLSYEGQVFHLNRTLDSLVQKLENGFPRYHALKYQNQTISIAKVQQKLSADEALIEYFDSDSIFYTFLITKAESQLFVLPKPLAFDEALDQLRVSITNNRLEDESLFQFVESSHKFYQTLLERPLGSLGENINKLIIIPSEELLSIPWEMLVLNDQKEDFKNLAYLIKQYDLNYGYSSTIRFSEIARTTNSERVLAIAPSYDNMLLAEANEIQDVFRNELVPLKWAQEEVKGISNHFESDILIGGTASEKAFKQSAGEYGILHMSMHALVDHKASLRSKLVFTQDSDSLEDNYLHTFELFNMNLSAQLAVLSACNTGLGDVKTGEGIMSLARGFAYAGVPSVVMSHWKVDDKATGQLMTYFYQYLSEGESKSGALRKAKLKYLEEASPNKVHPFYWGAFVVVGDDSPVVSANSNWVYIMLIALALFFILLIVYRRRGKKGQHISK
ncbi:MAG: CHAT domain-containing tetratricopeptide repeat protein [Bacteroidota bacterium]